MTTTNSGSSIIVKMLTHVGEMLDKQQPREALEVINKSGLSNRFVQNARGVCLLRLGQYENAMMTFRDLVFPQGAFSIPPQTPIVLQTNYVTSLMLLNDMVVALGLLADIGHKQHPAVQRLNTSVRLWKKSLPWWRRLFMRVGGYPDKPIVFHFPPGELWVPENNTASSANSA